MDLYADNDELFAKLREGNPGYDLIVPTNDYVERMVKANMLVALDHAKIPNIANLDKHFLDADFDPGRKYSLPYMWGTIGIGYRKSKVDGVPDSWKWVFDSDKYAGRVALLGDAQALIEREQRGNGFLGEATMRNTHGHSRYTRRSFLAGTGAAAAGVALGPRLSWGAEEK